MDILKIFRKSPTAKEAKEKFIYFSEKKYRFKKAIKYLKNICNASPEKCVSFKKTFFTIYKDKETEVAVKIGDQIVDILKDTSFTKVLAIRHKRLGNLKKYEELLKLLPSNSTTKTTEKKDIKSILLACKDDEKLQKSIDDLLKSKKENPEQQYKLIFSALKDTRTAIAVKYGMLYFKTNPFDIKFAKILTKRVETLILTDELLLIKKYNNHYTYIKKLLSGALFKNDDFDKKKFQKQLKIVSNTVPSVFIEHYIEGAINRFPQKKDQIAKEVTLTLKNTHTPLALHYGKIYLAKNKHDIKFKKVLLNYEKKYRKEKEAQDFIDAITSDKLFLQKSLSIKQYTKILSKTTEQYDNDVLIKIVNMFLQKFPSQKDQILRNTFSTLKDSHPDIASNFGITYVENNIEDIKFAKVLLNRLKKLGKTKEKIKLAQKLYAATNDENFEYIIVEDELNQKIEQYELLYSKNKIKVLHKQIADMIRTYPKYKALIYRKLLKFYAKKEYKQSEKYALKSLELHQNEYVIKELYDLHITYGHLQKALSVLPKEPKIKTLKTKQSNGESLYHLFKHGFDVPIKKIAGYTPKKNKVFYLLHNRLPYNSGGYATRSHGLLTGVSAFGWEMHGVSRLGYPWDKMPDKKSLPKDIVDDIPYHRLLDEDIGLGKLPLKDYLEHYANSLLELAQKEKPEMIHAASNYMNGIVANYVAKCLGIPSIYEVRGLWEITRISREPHWKDTEYYNLMSKMEADAAKGADIVFTLTEALRDEMVSRGVKREKIHLLPNGVVSKRFSPLVKNMTLAETLNIKDKTVVGFIGSFVQYEGLDYIVDAMEILIKKGRTDIVALMVGDGTVAGDIRSRVTSKGLDAHFVFTGRIPHDEVEEYYSLVDIAPLPRKGLPVCEMVSPLKPFEAMAMEKVVLSSNVAALAEIVKDDYNGMLFKKDNIIDLAEKIELLADNPKLRKRLGKQARKWVIKERDWGTIAKNLHEGYSRIRKG